MQQLLFGTVGREQDSAAKVYGFKTGSNHGVDNRLVDLASTAQKIEFLFDGNAENIPAFFQKIFKKVFFLNFLSDCPKNDGNG